jgi:DNA-binding winged helix-turn-helix (wHTH) protein
MTNTEPAGRYRFGVFEADASTGELRRKGIRIKLGAQPFQMLLMLLERQGELVTREEIYGQLWPDGTFVDAEHGVNSAVNRIREALGDAASSPRFLETLARRGYRFVAPVERIDRVVGSAAVTADALPEAAVTADPKRWRVLASPEELPKISYPLARTLFILLQVMYVGFYVGALANLAEIEGLLSVLPRSNLVLMLLIVTAALLIPARAFVISAVLLQAPRTRAKFLSLWRFLLPLDVLWALSPFLLLHHINAGLAIACTALLVYSPFAQRSLMLMGADGGQAEARAELS